tara:strand:- start:82 stop:216 length:135 start_codon:yes stop_codon:yes gene_type:complete
MITIIVYSLLGLVAITYASYTTIKELVKQKIKKQKIKKSLLKNM